MKVNNKRAFYDYEISDRLEAGINLTGAEVKAVKGEHADLTGAFVRIIGSEAYLVNSKVFPLPYARPQGYQEDRTRKLLLHKKEIIALKNKSEGSALTLVPISLYDKGGLIKVEIGIGKGKRKFEKKEAKKRADLQREIDQELVGN